MKWYNLKANKCPKCSAYLTGITDATILICSDMQCDFKITTHRFSELSTEIAQKHASRDQFDGLDGWGRFQD